MPSEQHLLKIPSVVQINSAANVTCEVTTFLGGGGQGEVFKARLNNVDYALKYYYPHSATERQLKSLEELIKIGPPTDQFLWPIAIAKSPEIGGFGYLMGIRRPEFKSLFFLMGPSPKPSFKTLATAGYHLANSFLALHSKGLCYCDISFGNVFFDPESGEILICDNDNVGITGKNVSGVAGTLGFMAPEVVLGHRNPSTYTDLFSLSVLLFHIFFLHHPLDGKMEASIACLDPNAKIQLYGRNPVFIFDPQNEANRPDPRYHANPIQLWPLFPRFFQNLFIQAFTRGIKEPENGRIRESEWRAAMIQLRDLVTNCNSCGGEIIFDPDPDAAPYQCWSCGTKVSFPPRLKIGKNFLVLNKDTRLFNHHIDSSKLYDFKQPKAEVNQHPKDPTIWGLKNLSESKWSCTKADGKVIEVEPGKNVTLSPNLKINFGNAAGEIIS